jgi:hypothetical protein
MIAEILVRLFECFVLLGLLLLLGLVLLYRKHDSDVERSYREIRR